MAGMKYKFYDFRTMGKWKLIKIKLWNLSHYNLTVL